MTTNMNTSPVLLAAHALAVRDGLDYFERENQAGIADLVFVAEVALQAAREAGDGAPDGALSGDPIAVGAAARALSVLEDDEPFGADAERLSVHLEDARAMLAALGATTSNPALAAA